VSAIERGDHSRRLLLERYDHAESVSSLQRERADQPRERPIDGVGLLVARLVVRVDLGRLGVRVAHPVLERAHRRARGRHARAERMAQLVERDPVNTGAIERLLEPADELRAVDGFPVSGWQKTRSRSSEHTDRSRSSRSATATGWVEVIAATHGAGCGCRRCWPGGAGGKGEVERARYLLDLTNRRGSTGFSGFCMSEMSGPENQVAMTRFVMYRMSADHQDVLWVRRGPNNRLNS
jgi:hypothetical protein